MGASNRSICEYCGVEQAADRLGETCPAPQSPFLHHHFPPNQPTNQLTEFMVYASFAKCGCIAAMTVDRPEYTKDTAKTVTGWIKSGYTVRRLPDSEMHQLWDARQPKWGPCLHEKPQQASLPVRS